MLKRVRQLCLFWSFCGLSFSVRVLRGEENNRLQRPTCRCFASKAFLVLNWKYFSCTSGGNFATCASIVRYKEKCRGLKNIEYCPRYPMCRHLALIALLVQNRKCVNCAPRGMSPACASVPRCKERCEKLKKSVCDFLASVV